jgi:hypothetical protein
MRRVVRFNIGRIMQLRFQLIIAGLLCLAVDGAADLAMAQEPELIVEIEKQEIYEGESVLYRVTLNHVENPTAPVLAGLNDFQVTSLGEQSLNSQQITILNGRRTEIVRRGMQYNYRLTPRQSGLFTIPAPTAKVGNDVLNGREVTLRVVAPEVQDSVILELTVDRNSVFPMQPFELLLTVAVKELPGDLKERDPLSVQPKPPALNLAWLTDEQIPDGLDVEKNWREILEPMVSRQGNGVQINNIGSQSVFSLFDSQATAFHPTPKRTKRKDANGEDVGYWEYRFRRKLIPRKLGEYQFGPATLKGTFADKFEDGRLAGREVYVFANSLTVTVKDVPFDGRPESYIGAVGTFVVEAELAPASARVGDPMTLTVTLTGQGTLADARPPEIALLPGIANQFRMYEATEETKSGSRRFTYSLRPLSTSVTEFPPIPVSFFDVEAEKYVTRMTKPIEVTIREAETLSGADIVSSPGETAGVSTEIVASEGGIFANDSSLSWLRNESIQPVRWIAAWAGMLAAWAIASLAISRVRSIRKDPALQRRRSAATRVKSALAEAAKLLDSGSPDETCDAIRRAVSGLIADFADVSDAGLTPRDAAEQLTVLGVEGSLRDRTVALLNDCDAARYGAASNDVSRLHAAGVGIANELMVELKKSPVVLRKRLSGAAMALLLLGSVFVSGCSSAPDLEASKKFQDAAQAFAEASTPDDFARVARLTQQVGDADFVSRAVLYNEGNAWMRAGETGRAIASYRQAQRYRPRDPYLEANLKNALSATHSNAEVTMEIGIAGYVFFWQNWLSYPEKFVVTTTLLAATLLLSLIGQFCGTRGVSRRLTFGGGLLCVIFMASTGWDWQRFDRTLHGVVTSEQAVARKGNADSYEAAFKDSLAEGTEFIVHEERNGWVLVQVGDAGTGWLSNRDVAIY